MHNRFYRMASRNIQIFLFIALCATERVKGAPRALNFHDSETQKEFQPHSALEFRSPSFTLAQESGSEAHPTFRTCSRFSSLAWSWCFSFTAKSRSLVTMVSVCLSRAYSAFTYK